MSAANPQPDPSLREHVPLHILPAVHPPSIGPSPNSDDAPAVSDVDQPDERAVRLAPVVPLVASRRAPSRTQALAVLLVLPLALVATAVIVGPPRSVAQPEVLVVGQIADTRWAHDTLTDLGPVVLSSAASRTVGATTEIHYRGPGARAQAEAVRRSLGRGRLVDAPALKESFPVIVYLGKDTPTQ